MLYKSLLIIATLGPEERPILSQRDEGWAEDRNYFHVTVASHPTAYLIIDHILATNGEIVLKL
jgi:hypothetical protein